MRNKYFINVQCQWEQLCSTTFFIKGSQNKMDTHQEEPDKYTWWKGYFLETISKPVPYTFTLLYSCVSWLQYIHFTILHFLFNFLFLRGYYYTCHPALVNVARWFWCWPAYRHDFQFVRPGWSFLKDDVRWTQFFFCKSQISWW